MAFPRTTKAQALNHLGLRHLLRGGLHRHRRDSHLVAGQKQLAPTWARCHCIAALLTRFSKALVLGPITTLA